MAGSLSESRYLIENAASQLLDFQLPKILFRIRNKNSQDDKIWQVHAKLLTLKSSGVAWGSAIFLLPDESYRESWRTPLDKIPDIP